MYSGLITLKSKSGGNVKKFGEHGKPARVPPPNFSCRRLRLAVVFGVSI